MSLLVVDNVRKSYANGGDEVHALNSVTLEIDQGEFVAVMGPSGSGKSTLLTVLGGLSHPSEGRIIVDGIDIYALSVEQLADFRREYVGFIFQSFQLIPYLTVLENVMVPLVVTEASSRVKREMALGIAERVGLQGKAGRLPDELSGGEQERVAIARALVNRPPIVLADEPTGNLDTSTGDEIMKLFQSLNGQGQTIVMVTHNPENVQYAQRRIRLKDGRLEE